MTAKILIVDDTFLNIKYLKVNLEMDYYKVFVASNAKEAFDMIPQVHPDIILLDVMMPGIDGFEAAKILKANPETTHIPIIMVTALNAQHERVDGLESGADDFISKPVDYNSLAIRIKSLIRMKMMVDELKLRDQTGMQYGLLEQPLINATTDVSGSNIILVDDDVIQQKKIKEAMVAKNFNVDCFKDCDDVMRNIDETKQYSLMIVNTQISGEGNWAKLCSSFKNDEKLRHVPVLAIIDEKDEETLPQALELGVNDSIKSPIDINEVNARVLTQLRRKKYQDMLKNYYTHSLSLAITDPLTNLYNRRYLDMHLTALVKRSNEVARSLSIVMLDLDHFKAINDNYGHPEGDAVLQELGKRIMMNTRANDLCTRYGGEEFIIVMPDTDPEQAKLAAERLRIAVESIPFIIAVAPGQVDLTASLGVATLHVSESASALIGRADTALYGAKNKGRNQVISAEENVDTKQIID